MKTKTKRHRKAQISKCRNIGNSGNAASATDDLDNARELITLASMRMVKALVRAADLIKQSAPKIDVGQAAPGASVEWREEDGAWTLMAAFDSSPDTWFSVEDALNLFVCSLSELGGLMEAVHELLNELEHCESVA